MPEEAVVIQRRKRSRVACETCRELKRKCDGAHPCGTCVRFEYDCSYLENPAKRHHHHHHRRSAAAAANAAAVLPAPPPAAAAADAKEPRPAAAPAVTGPPQLALARRRDGGEDPLRSLEANSGAAFVRKLALGIDPYDAPRMHLFAWNAFMGSREEESVGGLSRAVSDVTDIVSLAEMEALTGVYFDKVDPCYGFIDRRDFEGRVRGRWERVASGAGAADLSYDAVLCGVAGLACLFSRLHDTTVESELVGSAKASLERAVNSPPSVDSVKAWLLRVAYLRITSTPHATWMASSILMHMVEAANLHSEPASESVLHSPSSPEEEATDPDTRRRLFGIAQHLNIWTSFDMGRSRVVPYNATTVPPRSRPGSFTAELLSLLPYSAMLDPEKSPDAQELETALSSVLALHRREPPFVLGQTNLVLCIWRRLKSLNMVLRAGLVARVLALTRRAIQAASSMVETDTPWHHITNVPFQVVCILLVTDSAASMSQLPEAMQCLSRVAERYNTDATREALRTASLLILLHQRKKMRGVTMLDEVLGMYPVSGVVGVNSTAGGSGGGGSGGGGGEGVNGDHGGGAGVGGDGSRLLVESDAGWLDELMAEVPAFLTQDFGLDQTLGQGIASGWDVGP